MAAVAAPSAAEGSRWPVAEPVSAANPVLEENCDELNLTLLMDASGSVKAAGQERTMKDAAWSMVTGLQGTNAKVSIVHFATGAKTWATQQSVTGATVDPGGSLYTAIESYRASSGTSAPVTADQYRLRADATNPLDPAQYEGPSGYAKDATNWQMALEAAADTDPDLVVLLTDGEPTAVVSSGKSNTGMAPDPHPGAILQRANSETMLTYGYHKGVLAANTLKDIGSRMTVVGVGSGNNFQAGALSRMQAIAGPTGAQAQAGVWFGEGSLDLEDVGVLRVRQWDALESAMHQLAMQVAECKGAEGGALTVTKAFDPAGSGFDGTFSVMIDCEGGGDPRTLELGAGESAMIEGIPAGTTCTVSEPMLPPAPPGWTWGQPVLDPVDGRVVIEPGAAVAVAVTNSITGAPAIELAKEAEATGFDEIGDVITYRFTATNSGLVTLSDVEITDPLPGLSPLTCEPAQPAVLAPGASMDCTAAYTVTQSDLDAGLVDNTATVTGVDPTGEQVSASDSASVPGAPVLGGPPPSDPGDDSLAATGAGGVAQASFAALILLGAGAALLALARRRA